MADVVAKILTTPVALGQTVAFRKDKGKHNREESDREAPTKLRKSELTVRPDGSYEEQGKGHLVDIRA